MRVCEIIESDFIVQVELDEFALGCYSGFQAHQAETYARTRPLHFNLDISTNSRKASIFPRYKGNLGFPRGLSILTARQ